VITENGLSNSIIKSSKIHNLQGDIRGIILRKPVTPGNCGGVLGKCPLGALLLKVRTK